MSIKIPAGVDYHLLYKPNCMITFLKHMLLWLHDYHSREEYIV